MSTAAVVVTYNRLGYLKECLAALKGQTRLPDEIIIVDNGSTDGSLDYVRAEHPDAFLFETGANLGGAGGFAWGVELAIARGHEFAWLMDDDAAPARDSLAPLLDAFERSSVRPGFVASVVEDHDGNPNQGHLPAIDRDPMKQMVAQEIGCIAIEHATFVGVLIDLHRAAAMHLPMADFFIWLDDAEYTRRLSHASLGLCVPASRIMHPEKTGSKDMGPRMFHFVRNQIWLSQQKPGPRGVADSTPFRGLELALFALREQWPHAEDKGMWARSLGRGLWQGMFRSPRRVMPGDLLATLPESRRREITAAAELS